MEFYINNARVPETDRQFPVELLREIQAFLPFRLARLAKEEGALHINASNPSITLTLEREGAKTINLVVTKSKKGERAPSGDDHAGHTPFNALMARIQAYAAETETAPAKTFGARAVAAAV